MKIRQDLKEKLCRNFDEVVEAENTYYPLKEARERIRELMESGQVNETETRNELLNILIILDGIHNSISIKLEDARFAYEQIMQIIAEEQDLFYAVDGKISFPDDDDEEPEEE